MWTNLQVIPLSLAIIVKVRMRCTVVYKNQSAASLLHFLNTDMMCNRLSTAHSVSICMQFILCQTTNREKEKKRKEKKKMKTQT